MRTLSLLAMGAVLSLGVAGCETSKAVKERTELEAEKAARAARLARAAATVATPIRPWDKG